MGRRFWIVACLGLALGLIPAAPAIASGGGGSAGGGSPSAGDNQYIDPLAGPTKPKHPKPTPTTTYQAPQPAASSVGSAPAYQPAAAGQSSASPAVSSPAAPAPTSHVTHKKTARRTVTTVTAPTMVVPAAQNAASSSPAVRPPSSGGSSFPYIVLILALCAALALALLGRRVLFRRAVHRA